jgi:phosphatidylserine decarboxylase
MVDALAASPWWMTAVTLERGLHVLLARLSAAEGRTMDAPASAAKIAPFIATHAINMKEAVRERAADYATFNDFFARELKPEARPIAAAADDAVVVSPADCRAVAYASVAAAAQVWIKGATFTVETLLGPAFADVAPLFVGGAVLLSRLAPQDYHRWHMPVTGRLGRRAAVDGALYTVSPMAVRQAAPDVFCANKREVVLVHTRHFGAVAMVCVGATVVGSINIVLPDGAFAAKGACHGFFAFGGSTVLTIFQPGAVAFDADLLVNSQTPLETFVRVGERVGVAAKPAAEHAMGLRDDDHDVRARAAAAAAAAKGE